MQCFEKVTGSEVEVLLASTGGSGSGGGDTPDDGGDTPDDGDDTPDDGGDTPDGGCDDEFDLFWSTIDFFDTTDLPTPPSGGDFGVSGPFTEGIASKEPYQDLRTQR